VSQQINLFNPIFLKQKKYFSAQAMVWSLAAILVACGLMVLYADIQLSNRTKDAAASSALLLQTKGQLITVTAAFSPHQSNSSLDEEIKQTENNLHSMQLVFDTLKSGEFGDTQGYSGYFRAFAHQIIDGLWLTGVSIDGAGHDISLRGRTLDPQLIPAYLTRLKRESQMQGKSFAALEMHVPKNETNDAKSPKPPTLAPFVEFNLQSAENSVQTAAAGATSK